MDKEQQKEYAIQIAEKVCNYYQIKYGQMMSKYRGEEVTLARQMTMYLTKEKTSLNGEEIAQLFNRDRTTVLHSISKIKGQLSNKFDDSIKNDIFNLNVLVLAVPVALLLFCATSVVSLDRLVCSYCFRIL